MYYVLGLSDGHEWLVESDSQAEALDEWNADEDNAGSSALVAMVADVETAQYLVDMGQSMVRAGEIYRWAAQEGEGGR